MNKMAGKVKQNFCIIATRMASGNILYLILGMIFLGSFVWACSDRFFSIYLEDDALWELPLVLQMVRELPFGQIIQGFLSGQMTLFDGIYFSIMNVLFGVQLPFYLLTSLIIHMCNAGGLFCLLWKRMRVSFAGSFFASFIYLTFYGHFHAYMRPVSISHLMVVFFILLLANLYLYVEEQRNNKKSFLGAYSLTMGVAVIASIMRLSIVVVPVMMVIHILFLAKDGIDAWRKLRLWGPVFFILLAYNWLLLTVKGKEGRTLNNLLEFWPGTFRQDSWVLALVIYVGLVGIVACIGYFFLRSRFAGAFLRIFRKIIPWTLLIPQFFLVTAYNWFWAIPSAVTANPYDRWQPMPYPEGRYFFILLVVTWVMVAAVVKYIRGRGAHFSLFIGLYLSLFPFLGFKFDAVFSRYLIYISPVFASFFSVFVFEILAQSPKFSAKGLWQRIILACISLVIFMNIGGIYIRLKKSILGDYQWSYDYVKVANVIKKDLAGKNWRNYNQPVALCVQGVSSIGIGWDDFLPEKFDRYMPFMWTLRSAIGRSNMIIRFNDGCQNGDLIYRLTDRTVVDGNSRDIEPFYKFFHRGMAFFHSRDFDSAYEELRHAFYSPPFVMQLFLSREHVGPNFPSAELEGIAKTIKTFYSESYTRDDRIQGIENLVQKESMDYAIVLLSLAYLENTKGYVTDRFMNMDSMSLVASQWLKADDLREYPLQDYLPDSQIASFKKFADNWIVPVERTSWPKIENYHGYSFFQVDASCCAIPEIEKEFDLARFKRGGYLSSHTAETKHELRQWVDQQGGGGAGQTFETENNLIGDILDQLTVKKDKKLSLPSGVLSEYADTDLLSSFKYRIRVGGVPFGFVSLQASMEDDKPDDINFVVAIRPWQWLQKISKDSLGWHILSRVDSKTLLPEFNEENPLSKIKKGKTGRRIIYHHDQLYMERKIYKEDILPDTRDLASLLFWLMAGDYQDQQIVKTTMNIGREIYLVAGKACDLGAVQGGDVFMVKLMVAHVDKSFKVLQTWPVEMYFLERDGWSLPVLINLKKGPVVISLGLN